jgi:hypothetical protein
MLLQCVEMCVGTPPDHPKFLGWVRKIISIQVFLDEDVFEGVERL